MKCSWVIPKITTAHLCKPIHDIIHYSTFICSFKSRKCWKEEEKLQKSEYLKNKKRFLDEIKNIFHSFWRAIVCLYSNALLNLKQKKVSIGVLVVSLKPTPLEHLISLSSKSVCIQSILSIIMCYIKFYTKLCGRL